MLVLFECQEWMVVNYYTLLFVIDSLKLILVQLPDCMPGILSTGEDEHKSSKNINVKQEPGTSSQQVSVLLKFMLCVSNLQTKNSFWLWRIGRRLCWR